MLDETIYKSTPESKKRNESLSIPYDKLQPGLSVIVYFSECNEQSLRSSVSLQNAKSEKKFRIFKHKKQECFEVACVPKIDIEPEKQEFKIVESSPEAKAFVDTGGKIKYPFDQLEEGKSFIVPFAEANEDSLKVQCSKWSKKTGNKFVLLKHEKYGMFEVHRVTKKKVEFFQPSAEMQEKVSEYENLKNA